MATTWCQYSATSGKLSASQRYTRFSTSFLEAAATESHARLEELVPYARVLPHGSRDLLNVCTRGLAHRADRVDAGYPLCEEGIRC